MEQSYSNKVANTFYQKIGKLFFAVAMVDGSVRSEEIDRLKQIVRNTWLPHDDILDEYGSDAAFQIEIVFDWLLENEQESKLCYDEFREFYKENTKIFNVEVKELILKTANAIASAYAGKNKSELTLLGNLQLLFN
ncbi:hypothetical protein [Muriicola sp. Z0-33]|uniref:hypothetical protein n=1 Tax=Muriicola sp. Z0-33 TaxID=2816957 RepID=UPI0022371448|nr:hypothetical protein [Muriicola sp. Z0-33]MCW5515777.1 hypothetical protein [Muriicola sp. Z0-33]